MKTLFVTGQALGHIGRSLMVARALRDLCSSEIIFAGNNPFKFHEKYVFPSGFKTVSLGETEQIPDDIFAHRLEETIITIRPDVIVFDLSPVPWLMLAKLPPIPQAYITNYFLTKLGHHKTNQDLSYDEVKDTTNKSRRMHGLDEIHNAREFYEKNLVILADPATVVPGNIKLPDNYIIAGGVWWEPESALPSELEGIMENILYISIGSTGNEVPPILIESITALIDIEHVVIASAGQNKLSSSLSVPVSYFASLPGSKILARSSFVITQGGAGSCYQALGAGVPMGIWPHWLNHYVLGKRLEELGLGIILHPKIIEGCMDYIKNHWATIQNEASKYRNMDPAKSANIAAEHILKLH